MVRHSTGRQDDERYLFALGHPFGPAEGAHSAHPWRPSRHGRRAPSIRAFATPAFPGFSTPVLYSARKFASALAAAGPIGVHPTRSMKLPLLLMKFSMATKTRGFVRNCCLQPWTHPPCWSSAHMHVACGDATSCTGSGALRLCRSIPASKRCMPMYVGPHTAPQAQWSVLAWLLTAPGLV